VFYSNFKIFDFKNAVILKPGAYDFLLTFHSNHGPISYGFRDRRWFQSKIAKLSHPFVFCAHWSSPWNWVSALGVKKLEW